MNDLDVFIAALLAALGPNHPVTPAIINARAKVEENRNTFLDGPPGSRNARLTSPG